MHEVDINKINPALQPVIERLFSAFPATNATALTILTYAEDLSEYPIDIVAEAATNLRRTHKLATAPVIGEIISEVQRIRSDRQQAKQLSGATLAEIKTWKKEPIPKEIKEQLQGIYALMDKMTMPKLPANWHEDDDDMYSDNISWHKD